MLINIFCFNEFRCVTKIRDNDYIKVFGNRVRELRIFKKISQEDLAYEADIPINQIGRIERGEINTTLSTINVIAKALKVETFELFIIKKK